MYSFMFGLHSGMRWLVVLAGAIALVRYLILWVMGRTVSEKSRIYMRVFAVLIDIQVTIGVIFLVWNGLAGVGFPSHRIEHGVIMILAMVAAHVPAAWKKNPRLNIPRNYVFAIVAVFVLIVVGVMRLPQGWGF